MIQAVVSHKMAELSEMGFEITLADSADLCYQETCKDRTDSYTSVLG